jgi:hypothetical protein
VPASAHDRDERALPTQREMLHWIRTLVARGIRRPGFLADASAERWIARRLERFGMERVWLERIEVERWRERACALEVRVDGVPSRVDCFPVPFSLPAHDVSGEVALDASDAGGDPAALRGKIALYANAHLALPAALLRDLLARRSYDPEHDFDALIQRLPFGPRIQDVMEPALGAGARGFIGIVGQGWESNRYFLPYDAKRRELPGVWISPAAGARLLAEIAAGRRVEAALSYRATQTPATSHNVIATLAGSSDEWVIVGTHHDAPWRGAVEDGSGVALVLAQARYWSRVPKEQRPFNMLFLFNGGHMSGGAGIASFVERHRDLIDQSIVAIHLEHVAREAKVENGVLRPGEKPTPRWWFTSRIAPLEDAVQNVIEARDLRRSLILPPDAFFENPPTDGAFFYPAGVPIVQLLAAPEYLVDAGDTLPMVHEESLVPITRAVIDLVGSLAGWDGQALRALDRRTRSGAGSDAPGRGVSASRR